MLSPIAAWIAVRDEIAVEPALLGAVIFFWVGGFDIIYACQDADFDRERRLHSVPARWGIRGALRIALVSHLLTIAAGRHRHQFDRHTQRAELRGNPFGLPTSQRTIAGSDA